MRLIERLISDDLKLTVKELYTRAVLLHAMGLILLLIGLFVDDGAYMILGGIMELLIGSALWIVAMFKGTIEKMGGYNGKQQ